MSCLLGIISKCVSRFQRERLMANAKDLRVISQGASSVSKELAGLFDDVRAHFIFLIPINKGGKIHYIAGSVFYIY